MQETKPGSYETKPGRYKFSSSVELHNYTTYLKLQGISFQAKTRKGKFFVDVLEQATA